MAVDNPQFIDSALKLYNVEVHRAIKAQEEQLAQMTAAHDRLQDTINTLDSLPAKLRHEVMVPLGRHAFFAGQLSRTNEILVHLGDQYYAETSAASAREMLQRKLAVLAEGVSKAQQQLQAFKARLEITHSSLKDDTTGQNATEIRTSLEESDALLATASTHRRKAEAVRQQQQQQQKGPVSRVNTAGYSYTPLGISDGQGPIQQGQRELDPEDAALQARLAELIRLEQQQEAQGQAQLWGQQQQLQQQLAPIQEDQEEAEEPSPAAEGAGQNAEGAGQNAAAASTNSTRLAAVQHLQQLEEAPDSDDEEQHGQQGLKRLPAGVGTYVGKEQEQLPRPPQASSLPPQKQPQLKSALKKGFLTSATAAKPKASPTSASDGSSSSSSSSSSKNGNSSRSSGSKAFTGTVVERPAAAVVDAVGAATPIAAVVERAAAPTTPVPAGSSASGRPSKFKLRRMGLDEEAH